MLCLALCPSIWGVKGVAEVAGSFKKRSSFPENPPAILLCDPGQLLLTSPSPVDLVGLAISSYLCLDLAVDHEIDTRLPRQCDSKVGTRPSPLVCVPKSAEFRPNL